MLKLNSIIFLYIFIIIIFLYIFITTINLASPQHIVFLIGLPGAGKTTLCKELESTGSWIHFKAGTALQEGMKNHLSKEEYEEAIEHRNITGAYDENLVWQILKKEIEKTVEGLGEKNLIIDGFPRNSELVSKVLAIVDKANFWRHCITLYTTAEISNERLLQRKSYEFRTDDKPEVQQNRIVADLSKMHNIECAFKQCGVNTVSLDTCTIRAEQVYDNFIKLIFPKKETSAIQSLNNYFFVQILKRKRG